jgi:hypothetical protein
MRCALKKRVNDQFVISRCHLPNTAREVETYFVLDAATQSKPKALIAVEERGLNLVVTAVDVKDKADMRQRFGTRLYEYANQLACERGLRLTSDSERSQYAESFWRKQTAKGRAECIAKGRAVFYAEPTRKLSAEERAKLPQPEGDSWPCKRYGVPKPCEQSSLEGVRHRKKRRSR